MKSHNLRFDKSMLMWMIRLLHWYPVCLELAHISPFHLGSWKWGDLGCWGRDDLGCWGRDDLGCWGWDNLGCWRWDDFSPSDVFLATANYKETYRVPSCEYWICCLHGAGVCSKHAVVTHNTAYEDVTWRVTVHGDCYMTNIDYLQNMRITLSYYLWAAKSVSVKSKYWPIQTFKVVKVNSCFWKLTTNYESVTL